MGNSTPLFQVGQKVNWILADDYLAFRVVASARQPMLDQGGRHLFPDQGNDYIICPVRFSLNKKNIYRHVQASQLLPHQVID